MIMLKRNVWNRYMYILYCGEIFESISIKYIHYTKINNERINVQCHDTAKTFHAARNAEKNI